MLGESGFPRNRGGAAAGGGLGEILSREPTPDDAARFVDAFDDLIKSCKIRHCGRSRSASSRVIRRGDRCGAGDVDAERSTASSA